MEGHIASPEGLGLDPAHDFLWLGMGTASVQAAPDFSWNPDCVSVTGATLPGQEQTGALGCRGGPRPVQGEGRGAQWPGQARFRASGCAGAEAPAAPTGAARHTEDSCLLEKRLILETSVTSQHRI